jgi:enoyl reductase-like protein
MELAEQKRNTDSLELLEVWRSQLIDARIYKAENEIDDAPNEIELAIADIETVVAKAEERQEIIESTQPYQKVYKQKIKEDNTDQMSLF